MTHEPDLYRLEDRELLRRLMQRTGTGSSISIRALADAAGLRKSTVHNLLTGVTEAIPAADAARLTRVVGVDVLVLFSPVGRSVEAPHAEAIELEPQAVGA